jgi:hypothetical protein
LGIGQGCVCAEPLECVQDDASIREPTWHTSVTAMGSI